LTEALLASQEGLCCLEFGYEQALN